jgi:hypothetical protein
MISFSFSDLVSVVSVVGAFAALLFTVMMLYTQRRHTKYDDERHRIELELMRRSIESQMYGLNEKLLATEDRWRDVNHLLISSQSRQPDVVETAKQGLPSTFFSSAGISPEDLTIERDLIFVLTPFHPTYKKQFEVIASVCSGLGLKAMRGDEEFVSGDVFPHILRLIARARIVVANIDGRNPNVFYELGIAHAMGKPTILIAPTPEDVPFDVRTKRLVLFQSLDELREKLRDELARVVVSTEQLAPPLVDAKARLTGLLPEARLLLKEASRDPRGAILHVRFIGGTEIQTNGKNLISSNERRDIAKWEQALEELTVKGLVVARGVKGELFELSNIGYQVADTIEP